MDESVSRSVGVYTPPSNVALIIGWLLVAGQIAGFFLAIPYLTLAILVASYLLVTIDATMIHVDELRYSALTGVKRYSVREWGTCILLVWIVFPYYLIVRNSLARDVRKTIEGNLYLSEEDKARHERRQRYKSLVFLGILVVFFAFLVYAAIQVIH